jgi:acetyl-CoA synthetase
MNHRYRELYDNFTWEIPKDYNIAHSICDRHAAGEETALVYEDGEGRVTRYTFRDLKALSNQLANALMHMGARKGDRIGILLSQQPETLIAHLAGFKIGAVNIPLFTLFGPEALQYRLSNSQARIVIVEAAGVDKILSIRADLPDLETIICVDPGPYPDPSILSFSESIEKASDDFTPAPTLAEDPALIIYTSGTTGPPKGALHAHRVLLGHLPGVEVSHNFFPQPGDFFWTPADWAWIGGLIDVLLPSLYHKIPVLACRFSKFDPDEALRLMARHGVRNAFLPPTALKMIRSGASREAYQGLRPRTVASGGEPLGEETLEWGRSRLGLEINEFYGQTEANLLVSNCSEIMPVKPGSMGRAVPGHEVAVIDSAGKVLGPGEEGQVAVRSGDPVMFLGYWQNDSATRDKFINDWMTTGDAGAMDEEGYFFFKGRNDDVITCAGYRIGPSEVEDCLLKHPAVSFSAVIGKPDPMRGQIVKAFIQLSEGESGTEELKKEIQDFVKTRLAAHEYPREVEFIKEIPLTITGKVKRNELRRLDEERGEGGRK